MTTAIEKRAAVVALTRTMSGKRTDPALPAVTRVSPKATFFLVRRGTRFHVIESGWAAWTAGGPVFGVRARCGFKSTRFQISLEPPMSLELCDDCALADLYGFVVYRFLNAAGQLIYVGSTGTIHLRIEQHRRSSDWWPDVASCRVVEFPTEAEARSAEWAAVRSECPKHNVRLQRPTPKPPQPKRVVRQLRPVLPAVEFEDDGSGHRTVFRRDLVDAALIGMGVIKVVERSKFLGISPATTSRMFSTKNPCGIPRLETLSAIRRALPELADQLLEEIPTASGLVPRAPHPDAGRVTTPGMAAGRLAPVGRPAATNDCPRHGGAAPGSARHGAARQGMEHTQGGRSSAWFDSTQPTRGTARRGTARPCAVRHGNARLGARGGVAAHTGVRVSEPHAGHGIAELGPAWLGWALRAVARPGKAWTQQGRKACAEVRVLHAHEPGWVGRGMVRPGSAEPGSAGHGMGSRRAGGSFAEGSNPSALTQCSSRQGSAGQGGVRHGAAGPGPAWHGMDAHLGDWQPLGFKAPAPTHGKARRGEARPGSAWLREAWSTNRVVGKHRGSSPRHPRTAWRNSARRCGAKHGWAGHGKGLRSWDRQGMEGGRLAGSGVRAPAVHAQTWPGMAWRGAAGTGKAGQCTTRYGPAWRG